MMQTDFRSLAARFRLGLYRLFLVRAGRHYSPDEMRDLYLGSGGELAPSRSRAAERPPAAAPVRDR